MNTIQNAVCNGVTNAVRRCVQNQNQSQKSLKAPCGVSINESIHRLGSSGRTARAEWMSASHMFGGGC